MLFKEILSFKNIKGCMAILRLENLNIHLQECEFNPKKPIVCTLGCNIVIPKDELKVGRFFLKKKN